MPFQTEAPAQVGTETVIDRVIIQYNAGKIYAAAVIKQELAIGADGSKWVLRNLQPKPISALNQGQGEDLDDLLGAGVIGQFLDLEGKTNEIAQLTSDKASLQNDVNSKTSRITDLEAQVASLQQQLAQATAPVPAE